jgi:hypothetical protein
MVRLSIFLILIAWALQGSAQYEEVVDVDLSSSSPFDEIVWPYSTKSEGLSSSCASQTNCSSCYDSSSFCHWCDSDQACHARGSVHGCFSGVSCAPPPKKNDTDDVHGCNAHPTCSECTLASYLCHWCAHDNYCHSVGSVYGCVTGVDCYSNDRCKRPEPESLPDDLKFRRLNALFLAALCFVGAIVVCCASSCLCLAGGIKGAYDDLAGLALSNANETDMLTQVQQVDYLLFEENDETQDNFSAADQDGAQLAVAPTTRLDEESTPEGLQDETTPLVVATEARSLLSPAAQGHVSSHVSRVPRRPKGMQRLYNACWTFYLITLAIVAIALVATFTYYPKVPEYSICNDAVAWKSVIDSLTSIKVSADMELLASVANPNHFDVALDMGKGSLTHGGAFVGTFDIPIVTVPAMSITDVLIIAHLSPGEWEAVSLVADYYQGKLVLEVDTQVTLRVPALFDFSFTYKKKGVVVHASDMSDRHLCHCSSWDEDKNRTMTNELLQ